MRAFLTLLLAAGIASAQVKIEAQPGLRGRVRGHRWSFLSVELTNPGEDTSGELQFTLHGDPFPYTRKVDLPGRNGRKRYDIYFRFRELQTEGVVKWIPAKGDEVVKPISLRGGNKDPYYVAGVWSSRPSIDDLGLGAFTSPQWLQTDDLPDHWQGYDALDVLVIDSPEVSSVSPAQEKALHDWIEAGGHVIIVGDNTWTPGGIDPVIQKLLPCRVLGGTIDGVPVERLAGTSQNTGDTLSVLKVQPQFGAFDLQRSDPPLWLRELRGSGMVDFLTFHPRQLKNSWDNNGRPFWGFKLIGDSTLPKEEVVRKETESGVPVMIDPGRKSAGGLVGWVTLFAFLYAVVVGPGVFWLQRKYRNVFTRALTFPAIVACFVVVAWLLNVGIKSGDLSSRRINLVYTTQDGRTARGMSYFSFQSPYEGTFVFSSQREGSLFTVLPRDSGAFGSTLGKFSDLRVEEDAAHRVNASMRPWIPETFLCEWKGEADPGVVSHLTMAKDKTISGTIENTGSTPLEDCRLVWSGGMSRPFDIHAKTTYTLSSASARELFRIKQDGTTEMQEFAGVDLVNEKADPWNPRDFREAYEFYALQAVKRKPFPKIPNQLYYNYSLSDQEWDAGIYSVMPQVDSGAVVLLGWREKEDASKVEIEGHSLDAESQTMYAVRLEVSGGR